MSDCVDRVYISALERISSNSIVLLTAQDIRTGKMLSCEAKVAQIHTIKILSSIRSIDVDDINSLQVQAFDIQGNVFSSLEGLKFDWEIIQNPELVNKVTYKEANYRASDLHTELEKSKIPSDLILLKGIKTGTAIVRVTLSEEGYENVEPVSIEL